MLNYTYSIVRSALARSVATFGLLPVVGIFHCNEQNAFNLADDLIEPFRPIVDAYVIEILKTNDISEIDTDVKSKLVAILGEDVSYGENKNLSRATMLVVIEESAKNLAKSYLKQDLACLVLPKLEKVSG